MPDPMKAPLITLVAAMAMLAVAPAANADTVVVDFESGPPLETAVNDDYLASAFVRFLHADSGFRPYRRSAPNLARSGTVVADVGVDVCEREAGPGVDCETPIGGVTGRLTRTARAVTVYAGLFIPPATPVTARLIAYRANGSVAANGASVPISHQGFTTPVHVASSAADIARFELRVEGSGATGAALGFDDLTLEYPANSLPDFSLTAASGPFAVLQGKTTDVPVQLTRLNNSNGNVHMSVTGLPTALKPQVIPAAVPGTQGNATVRLTAGPNAPPFEVPRSFTIRADPQGNANVAPVARSIGVLLRVAGNFSLQGPTGETEVPTCAGVDVPFKLLRDRAFTGTVALTAEDLPPGVTAEFLPGASIPPGGGFNVDATLRLRGSAAAIVAKEITIRAASAGSPARTIKVKLKPADPDGGAGVDARADAAAPGARHPAAPARTRARPGNAAARRQRARRGTDDRRPRRARADLQRPAAGDHRAGDRRAAGGLGRVPRHEPARDPARSATASASSSSTTDSTSWRSTS